jgi:hypothetical protein
MSETKTCPTCGAPLPSDATGGACPKCLLQAGFATGGSSPPTGDHVPTPEELAPKFPGLVIESMLGRGGMGVVYRARHKALDREVALKVLPERVAQDRAFADRFQREARALAKLQHPNIVAVHDFGETDGLFWLVMEFVDGANIRQAMRAGQIGPKEALAIVPQICDALQYAHEHGVVHRDIKPENVLLDRAGHVKVADFGLAKLMEHGAADPTLTGAGQVMGTPHYMAPEQWEKPTTVDHRADIYSLGVVFYEMLTGELPVGRFAAPSKKSDVDARIDEIVLRTLERERAARYQQVVEVKTDVGRVAEGRAPHVEIAQTKPRGRLSKLAVVGGLGVPLTIAIVEVVAALSPLGDSRAAFWIGGGFALLLAGWIVSIASWVRIRRSGDALRGLAWAVVGTVLPVVAVCSGVFVVVLAPGVEPIRFAGLKEENERTQRDQQARIDAASRIPDPKAAPSDHEAIEALWQRLRREHEGLTFERAEPFYDPAAYENLRAAPGALRRAAGLPLADEALLGGPLRDFTQLQVSVAEGAPSATAIATAADGRVLRFDFVRSDQGWRFSTASVRLQR